MYLGNIIFFSNNQYASLSSKYFKNKQQKTIDIFYKLLKPDIRTKEFKNKRV